MHLPEWTLSDQDPLEIPLNQQIEPAWANETSPL
jgi:hypothetical protein